MAWIYLLVIALLSGISVSLFFRYKQQSKKTKHYHKELKSFESIVFHTNDALFVIEIVNGKLLHVNQASAHLLGYSIEEIISKTYFDLIPAQFLQKSAGVIADVWENKGLVFNDIPYLHKSGEIVPVECSAKIGSFDEHPAIVIYARDIRERLKYENEIHEINTELKQKNKDITDSINYAKRIQQSMLPKDDDINELLQEHFVLYLPKDIVSGDFYWSAAVTSRKNNGTEKFALVAAVDCTGHGIPGALMSIVGATLLNQAVHNANINSPAEALNFLNRELPKNLKGRTAIDDIKDGMDMTMVALSREKMQVHFAGAMNPIYIISEGNLREIKGDKQPISSSTTFEKTSFTDHTFDLKKGDMIYLFTDGYADQFGGPKQKKFMYRQFKELLLSMENKSMKEQKNILQAKMDEWRGDLEQIDDILIIGIRI